MTIDRDLLRTKFAIPQSGASLIQRASLLARLDDALGAKLTLISAPAGFGKTTLVAQWINRQSQIANRSFAWLTLDPGDNDPIRFWRYVINACCTFEPGLGSDALDALRASPQGDTRFALVAFLNQLAQLDGPCALVLDDLHTITSPDIFEAMAFWLEQLPSAVHMIALTREDPPLPLARLRARGQLREIRTPDLRFTPREAEAFADQTLTQPISGDAIAQLDARLEGWPAGWRMALTLVTHEPQSAAMLLAEQRAPQPQYIVDFFVSEVLATQPSEAQDFLLHTAFLDRLNGSLCDAVTGRTDSAAQLERLERNNVFLQRLSAGNGEAWYRYHSLFAEAMRHVARQRQGEMVLRELAARASVWHQARGNLPEAIDAALAADDSERAAKLIEQFIERGGYEEVYSQRRWMERLPQAVLLAHPALSFAYASAVLFTSDRHAPATRERIEPYLAQAERTWRAEGSRSSERLGELLAFRAVVAFWQGDFAANSALAREALTLLPDSSAQWRGVSLLQVVGEELRAGRMAELLPVALESRALCAASGNLPAALAALTALSEISYWRGEFRQAMFYAEQTLGEAASPRLQFQSDQQMALTQLSLIAFEQNDLQHAHDLIGQAIDLGLQADEPDGLKRAVLLKLRAQHALSEADPARDAARGTLRQFITTEKSPVLIREAQLLQAHCALLDGDAATAQRALANLPSFRAKPHLDEESESLLRARTFLAQHKPGDALDLVREWRADARTNERARSEMEWAMVEALVHAERDDLPRAGLALADAMKPAQPEGIRRLFIEAGAPLAALLRESLPHWRDADIEPFARELLALMGDDVTDDSSAQHLLEPLSVQERRVLRLLVAGMTNTEIARELTVSVNTVKTHTQNIYRKLNVSGRDEAREAARRLKLV
jgi:LuxR family maltose regulon positive regulatory protein